MKSFMKNLAPEIWPPSNRLGECEVLRAHLRNVRVLAGVPYMCVFLFLLSS